MGGLPRPGPGLKGVLVGLLAIWLAFAVGVNWAGVPDSVFLLFCGNQALILQGEIWRLFTAPLMHLPSGGIGHIITALVGLYFLSPNLEDRWGTRRFLRFLALSALTAYALQFIVLLALPSSISVKLVRFPGGYWFGAIPVLEAVAIAWALSFKGQTVRLMFVLPVTSRGLILFVVAVSVLRLLALSISFEGLIAPFGGMLAGWVFGADPSPVRRAYLKFKLKRVNAELEAERRDRSRRVKSSGLRVIEGGKSDDDEAPRGPDGRYLN